MIAQFIAYVKFDSLFTHAVYCAIMHDRDPRWEGKIMSKRSFDRSTSGRSNIIDIRTGKQLEKETKPVVCERIRYYRNLLGMEQKELAAMIGVTANAVSNWESGRARPDINILPNVCEALRITLYQLFALDDPSIKYTASEELFMEDYRQLTPGHRLAVRTLTGTLLQVQAAEKCRDIQKLMFFERSLAAGIGDPSEFDDDGIPMYVYSDSLTGHADCVFTVNGDSMEPDYSDGSMVLVRRISDTGDLEPGDVGAFMIDNELYIKEYQPDGLHSYNPAYPVMRFCEFENVYLIGQVVGTLCKNDIAQQADVEKYMELHPDAPDFE